MLDLQLILSFYPEELQPFQTNILREYLQYKILESVFRSKYGFRLSFMGGTCIHIIHGSPRFSEDLDFDNRGLTLEDFGDLAIRVKKDLQLEGYSVELTTKFNHAYHAHFRFPSILYESGLSGHKQQKMLIQIDTEPQELLCSHPVDRPCPPSSGGRGRSWCGWHYSRFLIKVVEGGCKSR